MSADVVCVGELTLDHVVVEHQGARWDQPGGGALYSAIGALVWGSRPIICSVVGNEYPGELLEAYRDAGIDTSGVTRLSGSGLGIWLLHEDGGRRMQVPKASGATFSAVDSARPRWSDVAPQGPFGVHVAPQTVTGQIDAIRDAKERGVVVTLDVMIEPFIEVDRYRTGEALDGITALLLNEEEYGVIWETEGYEDLFARLKTEIRLRALVVKQGASGAVLVMDDTYVHVPALSDAGVDPTGAGDAFAGGFLATLLRSDDPLDAFVAGAVSASFVVEVEDALSALDLVDTDEADRRRAEGTRSLRSLR